ncbi:Alpha/Beta hydrolase protein [Panaeolus papilionaceus]|nr:Alpha/Beta hydrolase protein [Panaeolus papilionaceus]
MLFILSFLSFASLAAGIPSPESIGGDLTLLFQNDLNWTTASLHQGSILISAPRANSQGAQACALLNEELLADNGQFFKDDMSSLLRYQAVIDSAELAKQYWVAPSNPHSEGGKCNVISAEGGVQGVPCDALKLETLCGQSAPYRRNNATDLSPRFQVQVTSQVKSQKLSFIGTRDKLSFRFIGIPYADPVQRFEYSKPYSSSGILNALNYGSPCIQLGGTGSEDCLFLNIYTPFLPVSSQSAAREGKLKPVMFWIHGGSLTNGEGSDAIFDGGNMASRSDVVVVTINYRLGTMGFLALNDGVTNGNYGIGDQITALKWVQTHIASFGGDPTRVTVYGQSAGAASIRALLASPPAFGLFKGAIAQSNLGGYGYGHTYSEWMSIEDEYSQFAKPMLGVVGCPTNGTSTAVLDCLRGVDGMTLQNAPNAPRYIVQDGTMVSTPHLVLDGTARTAPAHVMLGWMRDDGADIVGSFVKQGEGVVDAMVGAGWDREVVTKAVDSGLFPLPQGVNATRDVFNVTSRLGTDGEFACLDQATLIEATTNNIFPSVWAYQFDRTYAFYEAIAGTCTPPKTQQFPDGDTSLPYFRCHSGEIYYVFGTLGQDSKPFRDAGDLLMSQVAVDAWGAFARSYNPNPTPNYLAARGYTATLKVLEDQGQWEPVVGDSGLGLETGKGARPLRIMNVPFSSVAWREAQQCSVLELPLRGGTFLNG